MAFTQADLNKINYAIANGQRRVRLNGREVEYFSAGDLLKLKSEITNELNATAATTPRPKCFRTRTNKGL